MRDLPAGDEPAVAPVTRQPRRTPAAPDADPMAGSPLAPAWGWKAAQAGRAAAGELGPFAQGRRADGQAVGCTSYGHPRYWPGRADLCAVEIGWTWLAASAQRTGINTEAELLLVDYAFETLGVARVDFKTDARNDRSRRALAGLGAQFEGVLRGWSPSRVSGEEGRLRDSAMFSLLAGEWPDTRERLRRRLSSPARSQPRR